MAETTPNYGLTKPLESEFYDVGVQNENMDKIDTALNKKADLAPTGLVITTQLPDSVKNVMRGYLRGGNFYAGNSGTMAKQELSKKTLAIYVNCANNILYRWDEVKSEYVPLSDGDVRSLAGVHNLRYRNGRFQIKNASNEWHDAYANAYKYFGIRIQISNEDPAGALTYIGDAAGHLTGYGAWKDESIFKNIKPCVLKDGVVQYYLNPENFAYKEDGNAADITSGEDGDVMIEIPKIGYKMTTDGEYHYIWLTDDPNADGYCYRAHGLNNEGDCDKIYIGAYLGYETNNKLYSLSGKQPTLSETIYIGRSITAQKGAGYEQFSFYPLTLLQCMFLMIYKNRNSKEALGYGRGYGAEKTTGKSNDLGMCYGEYDLDTDSQPVKFLGIEDFYGSYSYWVDGVFCDSELVISTASSNFNGAFPFSKDSGLSSNLAGWLKDIQGTNEGGFLGRSIGASETTGYANNCRVCTSSFAYFSESASSYTGAFRIELGFPSGSSSSTCRGRLLYKHKSL